LIELRFQKFKKWARLLPVYKFKMAEENGNNGRNGNEEREYAADELVLRVLRRSFGQIPESTLRKLAKKISKPRHEPGRNHVFYDCLQPGKLIPSGLDTLGKEQEVM
jgi:hypothetical protein